MLRCLQLEDYNSNSVTLNLVKAVVLGLFLMPGIQRSDPEENDPVASVKKWSLLPQVPFVAQGVKEPALSLPWLGLGPWARNSAGQGKSQKTKLERKKERREEGKEEGGRKKGKRKRKRWLLHYSSSTVWWRFFSSEEEEQTETPAR